MNVNKTFGAALLDLDGTLIAHQNDFFYSHLLEIYTQLGESPPSRDHFDLYLRSNTLFADIEESRRQSFVTAFWKTFDAVSWPEPNLIEGVEVTLDHLLTQGTQIAIITARTHLPEDVTHHLRETKLLNYISVISTLGETHLRNNDGTELKKSQILDVCQRIQVEPSLCMVAGDSPSDILSGKAAGVSLTVGLLSGGLDESVLKTCYPDLLLPALGDLKNFI